MNKICLTFLLLLVMVAVSMVQAQQLSGAFQTNDKNAIAATVVKLFAGMRAGDSALVRSVMAPVARFVSVSVGPDGVVKTQETLLSNFLKAIGTPHAEVWDERISNGKAEAEGNLGTYWCQYTFYIGNKFSHCGVDAFQLIRTEKGWKIFQVADTRRKDNCNLSAGPTK
ncbi:MAG: hypothetical protein COW65_02870 [Cytophagales bacterium CG18_big_fil_WC_8_21_14_2_50_42_9]|nr:MAG: hypothetical protein COW65_02870 [Cytophagales bacterium CG18_big_fil_WC_8_21_14_2_50_42_9]